MDNKCIDCILYKNGCTIGSIAENNRKIFCTSRKTPCPTCGRPTHLQQCTNCWEVECRIERYLENENGRQFMRTKLAEYEE